MNVTEALMSRRSVRAFLDRPVDGALLRRLMETAARAPSGGNLQPWRLHAISGAPLAALKTAMRERLQRKPQPDPLEYDIYPKSIPEPHQQARRDLAEAMYASVGLSRDNKMGRLLFGAGNFQCWGAPVALFCFIDKQFGPPQWSDLGMYLQSLMLLLREHGLDSCPQEAWSLYHGVVREAVSAPPELTLFCGMSIGYADDAAPVNKLHSERLPLARYAEFHGF